MSHRFSVGQRVRLLRRLPQAGEAAGEYEVVRQLPDEKGEFKYRIKSGVETYERVANESDLQPV